MGDSLRAALAAVLTVSSVVAAGCTTAVQGRPVAAGSPGATGSKASSNDAQCAKVDAPLTDIEPAVRKPDEFEPILRVPQPDGWVRVTELDSAMIRFAMHNVKQGISTFAASAVVTIESVPGDLEAADYFSMSREQLSTAFGDPDVTFEDSTLCGLPAQTIHYILPPQMATMPSVPATALAVFAVNGDKKYGVALTIQSAAPDNPDYVRDSEEIRKGFQVLASDSGPR